MKGGSIDKYSMYLSYEIKMKIIAHRGYWKLESEKNTKGALVNAFKNNFGIETDIRDRNGELVISHDISNEKSILLEEIIIEYKKLNNKDILELNIKADGIQQLIKDLMKKYGISNYFVFDMSIPEMVISKKIGINYFTRHSDIEKECVLYENAIGVWLDSFYDENWLTPEIINFHLNNNKKISIISAEIHGFNNGKMWKMLKENNFHKNSNVYLCTDLPLKAKEYFKND